MKAKELRIGNILQGNRIIREIKHDFYTDDSGLSTLMRDAIPAPLTEEWLLKFGFEYKSGEYVKGMFTYLPQQMYLIINGFEYDYNGVIAHPEYVHQLQNLYWVICNEELK